MAPAVVDVVALDVVVLVVDELLGLLLQAAASNATEQIAIATEPFRKPRMSTCQPPIVV
jgi:hypothetical protein